jgi:hypothetical protein
MGMVLGGWGSRLLQSRIRKYIRKCTKNKKTEIN